MIRKAMPLFASRPSRFTQVPIKAYRELDAKSRPEAGTSGFSLSFSLGT